MKQKRSTEDYLKTIYILDAQEGVRGAEIAKALSVTRPTVSVALKELEQEGYVWMDAHRLVHLTAQGEAIAQDTYERNQFFKKMLIRFGVDQETAVQDACEMEHSVSSESFSAMQAALRDKLSAKR